MHIIQFIPAALFRERRHDTKTCVPWMDSFADRYFLYAQNLCEQERQKDLRNCPALCCLVRNFDDLHGEQVFTTIKPYLTSQSLTPFQAFVIIFAVRRHVGMADEADSKSVVCEHVWVQVPLPALLRKWLFYSISSRKPLFQSVSGVFIARFRQYVSSNRYICIIETSRKLAYYSRNLGRNIPPRF